MKIKSKIILEEISNGAIWLKRFTKDEGFYIELEPCSEYGTFEIFGKGKTLVECCESLSPNSPVSKKQLFGADVCDNILETFSLTQEEKDYIIGLAEWADF